MKGEGLGLRRRRKKVRKPFFTKKKVAIFTVSLLVIALTSVFMLSFGGENIEEEEVEVVEVEKETGKINFLLAGVDKEASLTDTIMIASFDLDSAAVDILSIPRDTRMYVGGRYQKINAAYAIRKDGKKKGVNGTIEAVSRLTKIPINYYVEFNLKAFREAIDAVDGVYFDVPQNMNYDDPEQGLSIHLKKGYQLLDGNKAEQLVRFRNYPMGDIDRTKVQQNFIKALAEQKLNVSIIENIPDIYKTISENIKTNLELTDIARYMVNLSDLTAENVKVHELPGVANSTDYGASYWIVNMEELSSLVELVFGYDPTGATIHSADGMSASKDTKLSSSKATATPKPTATAKPESSKEPKVTKKPTATKKPGSSKVTESPKPSESPKATKKPMATPDDETEETIEPTKKPTEKPAATPKVTKEPEEAKEKESGEFKRPAAN